MPRAWVINEYSGYEGLTLIDALDEEPGPGEVRLRVEAFALNWGDMDLMVDQYSFSFPAFPARVGIEAAGVVEALGPDTADIELGARMCTLPYFYYDRGASTESLIIDQRYLTRAPAGLSAVECAAVWMQTLTAYYPVVELAQARPGSTILVTAGTGTAGTAALGIGRLCGATMIATTRSESNRTFLEEAGADAVFVTDGDGDMAGFLREVTDGHGIDLAFDPVGAGLMPRYAPALARDARIVFYGTLDGALPQIPFLDMFQVNAIFHPYSVFNYVGDTPARERGTSWVHEALAADRLRPRIDRVYPMKAYRDAWRYLAAPRRSHGKVVIETGL